jgi:hypothetical protein
MMELFAGKLLFACFLGFSVMIAVLAEHPTLRGVMQCGQTCP